MSYREIRLVVRIVHWNHPANGETTFTNNFILFIRSLFNQVLAGSHRTDKPPNCLVRIGNGMFWFMSLRYIE